MCFSRFRAQVGLISRVSLLCVILTTFHKALFPRSPFFTKIGESAATENRCHIEFDIIFQNKQAGILIRTRKVDKFH